MFSVRLEQYSWSFFFSAPATTQKKTRSQAETARLLLNLSREVHAARDLDTKTKSLLTDPAGRPFPAKFFMCVLMGESRAACSMLTPKPRPSTALIEKAPPGRARGARRSVLWDAESRFD